jgi:hypothetical protein
MSSAPRLIDTVSHCHHYPHGGPVQRSYPQLSVHSIGGGTARITTALAPSAGPRFAAPFYSLIETAKLAGVNPKIYLLEATHAALLNPGTALLPYALPA